MIQPNDLRIGNWVDVDGINLCINSIEHDYDKGYFIRYTDVFPSLENITIDRLTGIQLTDELLKKCGFELDSHSEYYQLHISDKEWYGFLDIVINIQINRGDNTLSEYITLLQTSHGLTIPCEFKYLHQLQNLFFVLFGKELKIEL